MRCLKCGKELSEDTKFCSYCGEKIAETTYVKEDVTSEVIKGNMDVNNQKKSLADKGLMFWRQLSIFEKICTSMLVAFALMCLIAVIAGKKVCCIIVVVSMILVALALLINKEIIKCAQKRIAIVALVIAAILTIPYMSLFRLDYGDAEKFDWSEIVLNEVIPETRNKFGEIISNSEDYLSLYIYKTDEKKYNEYIDDCKKEGFTVEAEESESSFYAYNDSGYKLSLYFSENDSKMHIGVDAPKEYGNLEWSTSELAKLLPVPKSNIGEIIKDDEKGYEVYVAETSMQEFSDYVSVCKQKGFEVDVTDSKKYFSAQNSEGYKLFVEYIGNMVVSIKVKDPEYNVEIEIECVENWIFSKYDVEIYIDDDYEDTLAHGEKEKYALTLTKGIYTIKFVSAENDALMGEVQINITKNEKFRFKISCSSLGIDVKVVEGNTIKEETETSNSTEELEQSKIIVTMSEDEIKGLDKTEAESKLREMGFTTFKYDTLNTEQSSLNDKVGAVEIKKWIFGKGDFSKGDTYKEDAIVVLWTYKYTEPEKPSPVYYSTNDYETAKKGNTGVFSYKNKSGSYDIYWIINFDEGYVYWFTEENGEESCDKVKIVSGDLNDKITVTWHDGGESWSWYLHFKYVNHPETLVVNDHNGFATEFTTTDLYDALELRDTKRIKEY